MPTPKRPSVWGEDYDGWALPIPGTGHPKWSHFVGSPGRPKLPKGCVRVKITPIGARVPDLGSTETNHARI
jgi:hypothetical protein